MNQIKNRAASLSLQVGDFAATDYNSTPYCVERTIVQITARDDTRANGHSQSGVLFQVNPPLKNGTLNTWYCSHWFEPLNSPNTADSTNHLTQEATQQQTSTNTDTTDMTHPRLTPSSASHDVNPPPLRVYISGPMSGLPENNFPAFFAAANRLRVLGIEVINPAEISVQNPASWHACMKADIKALCDCNGLALLDGWENSQDAHLELHLAHRLGLKVYTLDKLVNELEQMQATKPSKPTANSTERSPSKADQPGVAIAP